MSGPRDTYDVPAVTKKCMLARAARREKLRHEYLEKTENPYRMLAGETGPVFDEGIQRFHSMTDTKFQYFRPTVRGGLRYITWVVLPIAVTVYVITRSKAQQEHLYRTGQISYKDRPVKFI